MVRDTSTDNNDDSFVLSTPLRANFQINIGKIMSTFNLTSTTSQQQHQDDFTFLQPFQSERLNKNLNQLKSLKSKFTSSLRSQPYTLSKPVSSSSSSSNISENGNGSGSTFKSTSNALKARVSSMSTTLKALLYKPKLSEKVDISSLSSKAKQQQQQQSNGSNNKSLNNSDQENQQEQMIEDEYLKKNETVNDYLLKLSTNTATIATSTFNENNYLSDKIKKLSKEYDELIKTNQQQQKQRFKNHNGSNILMAANTDDDRASTTSSFSSYKTSNNLPKWTCLVCLNKNRDPIDLYCTICGSSKTSSSTHSYASSNSSTIGHTFTKPLFQRLTNKSTSLLHANTSLLPTTASSISSAVSPSSTSSELGVSSRKFTKTWVCQHCDYANDNLKIVCINCRTPKSEIKMESIGLSPQIKRKNHHHDTASVASSNSSNCSSSYCGSNSTITITKLRPQPQSNENNNNSDEINQPSSKRSKDNNGQLCTSCQHPIETAMATAKSQQVDLVTPTKPANMLNFTFPSTSTTTSSGPAANTTVVTAVNNNEEKQSKPSGEPTATSQPSLASLFNSNKWNCKTCLAPNPNDKDKCACCETPRETASSAPKKPPAETPLPTSATSTNGQPSLASIFNNNNKWNCKTCLAQNPNEKDKCACCETPREGGAGGSSKPDPFSSKSSNFGLPATTPTISVQFGSKTPAAGPITFGSSFSIPAPVTTSAAASATTNSNETKPGFSFGSKTPLLTSAPTILISDSSSPASKPLTFGSSSTATTEAGSFKFGAPPATSTETPKLTFGAPAAASTGENKLTFGASSSSSSPPSAKLPAFGSGSTGGSLFGSSSNSGGLTFGTPITNSDNKQTNNVFPGFNKPQEAATTTTEQPKQQQTGLFSSTTPASTTASSSSFGSLFGSSSGFPSSNTNTATTSTTSSTTTPSTTTNASILFGNKTSTTNLFGNASASPSSSNTQSTSAPFTFGASNNSSSGSSLFGATQQTTASSSLFGTNTLTNTTSGNPFGASTNASNTFGNNTATSNSTFGGNSAPSAFGASSTTGSGFGSGTGGSIFGSSNTPATTTASTTAPTFGLFNSAGSNPPATTTNTSDSIFNSAAKPAFTFGASTPAANSSTLQSSHSTPTFGLTSQNSSNTTTGFSGFGQSSSTGANFFGNQNDASKPQQSAPAFTFGAASSTSSAPSSTPFVFGAASSTNNDQSSQGQKRTNDQPPQPQAGFNFGSSTTTTSSFNFSSQPSMNFSNTPSSTAPGSAPFVFTSGDASNVNSQQTPRLYKRPTRKLGKK